MGGSDVTAVSAGSAISVHLVFVVYVIICFAFPQRHVRQYAGRRIVNRAHFYRFDGISSAQGTRRGCSDVTAGSQEGKCRGHSREKTVSQHIFQTAGVSHIFYRVGKISAPRFHFRPLSLCTEHKNRLFFFSSKMEKWHLRDQNAMKMTIPKLSSSIIQKYTSDCALERPC